VLDAYHFSIPYSMPYISFFSISVWKPINFRAET
jgi:hypothetical protein